MKKTSKDNDKKTKNNLTLGQVAMFALSLISEEPYLGDLSGKEDKKEREIKIWRIVIALLIALLAGGFFLYRPI